MKADVAWDGMADVFHELLVDTIDTIYLVAPAQCTLVALIDTLDTLPTTARVLATECVVNRTMDNFMLATLAADFIADTELAIRTTTHTPASEIITPGPGVTPKLVGPETIIPFTEQTNTVNSVALDESHFAFDYSDVETDWQQADPYTIDTPPLSTVFQSLEHDLSPATARDFIRLLTAADAVPTYGDGVDAVTLVLLAAARNTAELNDVAAWADEIGLASPATISRAKRSLEDGGVIATAKVPIPTGRPRQQLTLTDEYAAHDPPALADTVADGLTAN